MSLLSSPRDKNLHYMNKNFILFKDFDIKLDVIVGLRLIFNSIITITIMIFFQIHL